MPHLKQRPRGRVQLSDQKPTTRMKYCAKILCPVKISDSDTVLKIN